MEPVLNFGLEATRWLQTNFPQLRELMAFISTIGTLPFYMAALPLIYWCINKRQGKFLAYLLAISNLINVILKHAFREPRPYWLEPELGLGTDERYGVISGHVQSATVALLFIAHWLRRRLVWLLAILGIFLMALSRVYLGVHFVHDVLFGFLLGLVIFLSYLLWLRYVQTGFQNRILGQRLLVVIMAPLLVTVAYIAIRIIIREPNLEVAWAEHVPAAELASVEDVVTNLAILTGLGIGFILEASRVHFMVEGSLRQRVVRYLVGMVVTLAIWYGLGQLFEPYREPLWLGLPLRFLRYLLGGLWVSYYAPIVFIRLGLARATPEPEVSLTVRDQSIMRG